MDETGPIPRVNYEAMQRFVGQKVALFAELKSVEQGRVVVKTSDDADVTVVGNIQSGEAYNTQFVEVSIVGLVSLVFDLHKLNFCLHDRSLGELSTRGQLRRTCTQTWGQTLVSATSVAFTLWYAVVMHMEQHGFLVSTDLLVFCICRHEAIQ